MKRTALKTAALCGSYILEFAVCGFVGWLYEVSVMYVMYRQYEQRGFLHLPILPIYGFFGLLLLLIFRRHKNPVFVFLVSMAVTTAGELAASYAIEAVLHTQLWTYHMWKYNFQGRISLYSSLMFGGLSLLLVNVVHPLVRKMYKNLPETATLGMALACLALVGGDLIFTMKG